MELKKLLRFPLNIQLFGEDEIDYGEPEEVAEDDIEEDEESEEADDSESENGSDEAEKSDSEAKDDSDESKSDAEEKSAKSDEGTAEDKGKKKQDRDTNAKFAEARRKAQEEARLKAEREQYIKGFKTAVGGKNPFTGEEIKTDDDIAECEAMLEAKNRGLDPITDYHKIVKILNQERKANELKAQQETVDRQKNAREEVDSFRTNHKDVDIGALFKDETFMNIAQNNIEKIGLEETYRLYNIVKGAEANAKADKTDRAEARRQSSVGNLSGGSDSSEEFYSLEQLKKMTPEQIKANWKKVEKSYSRINEKK